MSYDKSVCSDWLWARLAGQGYFSLPLVCLGWHGAYQPISLGTAALSTEVKSQSPPRICGTSPPCPLYIFMI